jgi:hypothetical protein
MRYISRALLPGVLGFAVAVLVAACGGGSGLLSGDQATSLDNQLNTVAAAIDSGQCNAADSAARGFDSSVSNLGGVNSRLQDNLKQASAALVAQAKTDCLKQQTATVPKTKTKTKTSTTPTNTTTTSSTPTNTTPTQTSPATTTSPATATSPATTGTPTGTNTSGGAGLGTPTGTGTVGSGGASTGNGNGNGQ